MIQANYTLSFLNEQHRKFHDLIVGFGFSFTVNRLVIGTTYIHPTKRIEVILMEGDESDLFHTKILITHIGEGEGEVLEKYVPTQDCKYAPYSSLEMKWIDEPGISDLESLERELHIQINVRPKSLNSLVPLT